MSRRCDVCGRGPRTVIDRSHAMNATKRKVYLNLQTRWIKGVKKQKCTSCLRNEVKVKK